MMMQRVVVVGATGSGKTTFARALAQRQGLPFIEMDALYWYLPNWQAPDREAMRKVMDQATLGLSWVIDGNRSHVRDLVWARADTLVWLDYPLPLILWRLCKRTLKRIITKEVLWGHNRETLAHSLSRDSLILWLLKTQPRHRREYPRLRQEPAYQHLRWVHLTSPQAAQAWLDTA
jgi:adenylate kinase family enzyme